MIVSLIIITAVSILSGILSIAIRPTHRRMQLAISFVGGVMVGMAWLELIPESIELGTVQVAMMSVLVGFFGLFLLERFVPSHCHAVAEGDHESCCHDHQLTWIGTAFGLSIHSILEGVAIAAAWSAGGSELGIGVAIVVVLHKPFDALTLVATMRLQKLTKSKIAIANIVFGCMVILGAVCFPLIDGFSDNMVSITLGCAAGMFLCIALSDLLPELQFHGHDKIALTIAMLLGLVVSWGVSQLHEHDHGHDHHHDTELETTLQFTSYDANDAKL